MADERIAYREMAEQSIARSFKGILRVANIVESSEEKGDDKFLNPSYYGNPEGFISDQDVGYASAELALDGQLNRYTFTNDPYKHKKLPVTDSLGYYVNINVGTDGTTIGSDESNNGNDANIVSFKQLLGSTDGVEEPDYEFRQRKIFPVLNASNVIVGLKERILPDNANKAPTLSGGIINIDSSSEAAGVNAKIIVNNVFDHSPINITEDGKYRPVNNEDNPNKDTRHRTIYRVNNTTPGIDDGFLHYQDDIDANNLFGCHEALFGEEGRFNEDGEPDENGTFDKDGNDLSINLLDSYVDIVNLKQYVKEKINKWLGNNTVEVPTGQVIWQYIDLNKWYCSGNGIFSNSYMGHQPPMNNSQNLGEYSESVYQGVVKKGINRISGRSQSESFDGTYSQSPLNEIIPLYKRDYALCDGTTYKIYLPALAAADVNAISYDMFMDLFFAIGYQYTDFAKIRSHNVNKIDEVLIDGKPEKAYHWKHTKVNTITNLESGYTTQTELTDKDVLFGIDLVTILAYKAITNELKAGTGNVVGPGGFDKVKALNWLKDQKFPREYIFNTPIPESEGGMIYEYKSAGTSSKEDNDKVFKFEIGREVNSFDSLIRYYSNEEGKFVNCKVWQTAEVQAVLTFFTYTGKSQIDSFSEYCTFKFQVPNFVQGVDGKYTSGAFIGSSPYFWSDEASNEVNSFSLSSFSDSSLPHRHFIAMGQIAYQNHEDQRDISEAVIGERTDYIDGERPEYIKPASSLRGDKLVHADGIWNWTCELPKKDWGKANIDSYSFAEVNGLKYATELNNGIQSYVIKFVDETLHDTQDPRWQNAEPNRGITSTPFIITATDAKYNYANANSDGLVDYFMPESIQMLPLIKL